MFILEQEKTIILNLNNVSAIATNSAGNSRNISAKCNNNDCVLLGEYRTKVRAEEVLQEIKKAICENVVMFEMPEV